MIHRLGSRLSLSIQANRANNSIDRYILLCASGPGLLFKIGVQIGGEVWIHLLASQSFYLKLHHFNVTAAHTTL